jgi:hypothetical protein
VPQQLPGTCHISHANTCKARADCIIIYNLFCPHVPAVHCLWLWTLPFAIRADDNTALSLTPASSSQILERYYLPLWTRRRAPRMLLPHACITDPSCILCSQCRRQLLGQDSNWLACRCPSMAQNQPCAMAQRQDSLGSVLQCPQAHSFHINMQEVATSYSPAHGCTLGWS